MKNINHLGHIGHGPEGSSETLRSRPLLATRFFGCFNGSESSSTSNPSQTSTGSSGTNSPANTNTGSGTINYLDGGSVAALKSVANTALTGQQAITALALSGSQEQSQQVLNVVSDTLAATTQAAQQSVQASNTLLQSQLASQSALAANVQSGGQSGQDQVILQIAAGAAVLIGLMLFLHRK